jgi:uncharacterized membrane protein YbhN (UPF0104 family)
VKLLQRIEKIAARLWRVLRKWPLARGAVTVLFFAAVAWLLGDELRKLDPKEILAVITGLAPERVAMAALVTAACYGIVASYDRLSARYARVDLPPTLGFSIPFVAYAFNFNVGSIVGGLGFRFRLYSRERVTKAQIAAIWVCSIVTNWCGCLSVLGAMLLADPSALRVGWGISATVARLLGALALAPVAGYLAATALRTKPVRIRGVSYRLPRPTFAIAQIGLGSAFWLLVPLVLYLLRPATASIDYVDVAAAYTLAAVAGVVVRVPAGLGVIEAVFLEIFRGAVGAGPIFALLIAWRVLFLLAPLVVAAVVLAVLEYRPRQPVRA